MSISIIVAIAVGVISILGSFATVVGLFVTMKTNLQQVKKEQDGQTEAEKKTAAEVVNLLVTLREFMSAQSVINKQVSSILDSLVKEMGEQTKRTVEAATVASLIDRFLEKYNAQPAIRKAEGE